MSNMAIGVQKQRYTFKQKWFGKTETKESTKTVGFEGRNTLKGPITILYNIGLLGNRSKPLETLVNTQLKPLKIEKTVGWFE